MSNEPTTTVETEEKTYYHGGKAVARKFAFASGEVHSPVDVVAALATEAMEQAIRNAVAAAEGAYGLPAARDLG